MASARVEDPHAGRVDQVWARRRHLGGGTASARRRGRQECTRRLGVGTVEALYATVVQWKEIGAWR